jgi:hypothetical protein
MDRLLEYFANALRKERKDKVVVVSKVTRNIEDFGIQSVLYQYDTGLCVAFCYLWVYSLTYIYVQTKGEIRLDKIVEKLANFSIKLAKHYKKDYYSFVVSFAYGIFDYFGLHYKDKLPKECYINNLTKMKNVRDMHKEYKYVEIGDLNQHSPELKTITDIPIPTVMGKIKRQKELEKYYETVRQTAERHIDREKERQLKFKIRREYANLNYPDYED